MVHQHIPLKRAGLKTEWVAYWEKILWEMRGTDGDVTDYYYTKCTEKEIVLFYYYVLQGCVPPLLEVALHVGSPSLSMLCIMSPCYTLQLYQVVSPSLTLPSSRSSALSWLPLGYSLCPSIIIQSGYMPRPFPLLFQYKLDYVLHSCSLSYFCVWHFIFYFQI